METPRTSRTLSLELPCDAAAPAAVREALGQQLADLGWSLGDVMLVASELVTNAVLHSGSPPDELLQVSISRGPESVRISVSDPGLSGGVAQPRPPAEFGAGGWGLRVIEQLSTRWGSERTDRYQVWAELSLQRGQGGSGAFTYAVPRRI